MQRYHHLIVGLQLDDHDRTLIDFAELVSHMASSDTARFVHVLPAGSLFADLYAPEVIATYRADVERLAARVREEVEDAVRGRLEPPAHTDVRCEIVEGAPLAELLRIAKDDDIDLVIVGADTAGGTLAEKLARKAPCSVLLVPPGARAVIDRILVPVDFSDHAADAVDVALAFAEASALEEVHLLHVYDVPTTCLKLGLTYEQFRTNIRQHAEERFRTFAERLPTRGLRLVPHLVRGEDVTRTVHEQAEALGANLVVIGTRGRSASAAILLGSTAERVVRTARVPVVAVKRKGATIGLLEALFDL